ncbi:transcriptional regulator [Halorubellus sp. JP-L1]|uniref:transcriptional regulator n=1 Tax=Halorubellus sp. JP-L1 TaxID=2715753 RepID=UPI0014072859|nr:transcriptional regulator [Halorubellus sp. JP-L1]NHN41915.1 transcriptional regulator [Halorubellus sp. JP-L1]
MSREALLGNVTAMLGDAGFVVSDRCAVRPKSFDLVARRGEEILLVKVLANVDALDAATGAELRRLGAYLNGTPIVIGLRTRDEDLKPDVTYFRHGIPVISPDTAVQLFVDGLPPLIYAAPGGLYVTLDGDLLADERQREEMSLGQLAKELGVSRRTVSKYEDGMNASVEVAQQLEELFDAPLTAPVDVMDGAEDVREADPMPDDPEADPDDAPVVAVLRRAGFSVHPTLRAPFKAVSEDEEREGRDDVESTVLTGHSEFNRTAEKRARIMASIGNVTRTRSVYFVDRSKRESVEGTAIIEMEEVEDVSDAETLRDIIRERSDVEEPA